jgi:RNA polymerase sigma factor (sigma-70 family)
MKNFENVSDEQMVEFVIRFDRDLYRDLIKRHKDELTDYAKNLIGDKKSAVEVVKQTFIRAYQNLRSFDTKSNFLIWLYTILQKEAQRGVDKTRIIKLSKGKQDLEVESDKQIKKIAKKIKPYLHRLDIETRSIAILHYLMNKSEYQISEILGLSEKKVEKDTNIIRSNLNKICSK